MTAKQLTQVMESFCNRLTTLELQVNKLPQTADQCVQISQAFTELHINYKKLINNFTSRYKQIEAERARIEADLLKKQRLLEQIAESTPAILYVYDLYERRNIYSNRQLTEILGYSPTVIQSKGTEFVQTLIHPDDKVIVAEIFHRLATAKDKEIIEAEYRMCHRNGEWRWLNIRNVVLNRDTNGSPSQVVGTATDITRLKQTEQELRQSQAKYRHLSEVLEQRVAERTAKLSQINEQLSREISDRKQAETRLVQTRNFLQSVLEHLPIAVFAKETKNFCFVLWNSACQSLMGYTAEEVLAKTDYDLFPKRQADFCIAQDREVVANCQVMEVPEELIWTKQRELKIIRNKKVAICNGEGNPEFVLGFIEDITEPKRAEEKLRASLQEKEVLLAEVHHRVKNNLYVISSLLELQMDKVSDLQAKAALEDSCNRISSMALVHENLYRTNNFSGIDFAEYVQQLARDLLDTYIFFGNRATLKFDTESVFLGLDQAIPCGLLLNELVTNAFKHSFSDGRCGNIYIHVKNLPDDWIELAVGNDGNSLPIDFDIQQNASMGLKLVMLLVEQLMGKVGIERGDVTWFKIQIFPSKC
ncbi:MULTISPECIES: PAS domain-containing sensor histidine kinase [Nostocales]|uniref:histidine kinase n=3 Tax=Nostocales TaxID=1161 RepID=A0A0C1RDC4_9CYAN|nr:PAS domain S-box protein [Tolypothrix bouteillei]KAF3886183.1 PAS domain S-box protein [Tolypothrix bouteillei VB521301]